MNYVAEATLPFELEEPDIYNTGVEIEDSSTDIITEPFDPTLIRIKPTTLTVDLILKRIQYQEIEMAPDFQRQGGIWNDINQSRLIESLLVRIPLPAFYMDATTEDRWLVVDGLQRLTTLKRFVLDKNLILSRLEFLSQFNGKSYDDLPRAYQRRILETQLTVFLIEEGTPYAVKFNVFKRINTGGMPLSPQEIRHALNQGPATSLLGELAAASEFRTATNGSIRSDRMEDRECVLRYIAFTLAPYSEYKTKDFDTFLSDAMKVLNAMSEQQRLNIMARFRRTMSAAYELMGEYAFRKYHNVRTMPINKPLFEAWSVNLDRLTDEQLDLLIERKEALRDGNLQLLSDQVFQNAISLSTGDIKKVRERFSRVEKLIQEVLA